MKRNGYLTKKEKEILKAELDKAAIGDRIISLRKIAEKLAIKRMKREQVIGVVRTFIYRHPDYYPVKMLSHEDGITSLFHSITFIERTLISNKGASNGEPDTQPLQQ